MNQNLSKRHRNSILKMDYFELHKMETQENKAVNNTNIQKATSNLGSLGLEVKDIRSSRHSKILRQKSSLKRLNGEKNKQLSAEIRKINPNQRMWKKNSSITDRSGLVTTGCTMPNKENRRVKEKQPKRIHEFKSKNKPFKEKRRKKIEGDALKIDKSLDSIDTAALKNMEDSIKSFLSEKAAGIRTIVNETASVFEGEGECIEKAQTLQQQTSCQTYEKSVFLEALFENVTNIHHRYLDDRSGLHITPESLPVLKKKQKRIEENSVFESTGEMSDNLFSNFCVPDKLLCKKNRHQRRSNQIKTNINFISSCLPYNQSNEEHENYDSVRSEVKPIYKSQEIICTKIRDKTNLMKCEIFESLGENKSFNDVLSKNKADSTKFKIPKVSNFIPHTNVNSRHHTKFTICRHNTRPASSLSRHKEKSGHKALHNETEKRLLFSPPLLPKDRLYQECTNHPSFIETVFRKKVILNNSFHKTVKSSTNEDDNIFTPKIYYCHNLASQIFMRGFGSTQGYQTNEFRVSNRLSLLMSSNDPNFLDLNHEKLYPNVKFCTTVGSSCLSKVNCGKNILRLSKSCNDLQVMNDLKHDMKIDGKQADNLCMQIKSVFSEPIMFNRSLGKSPSNFSISARHKCVDNKKVIISNSAPKDIVKEEIYECYTTSSDYVDIKHYVQIKTTSTVVVPEESVRTYTLDTRDISKKLSYDSFTEKQKTFNSLFHKTIERTKETGKTNSNENRNKEKDADIDEDIFQTEYPCAATNSCTFELTQISSEPNLTIKGSQEQYQKELTSLTSCNEANRSIESLSDERENVINIVSNNSMHKLKNNRQRTCTSPGYTNDKLLKCRGVFLSNNDIENIKLKFEKNFSHNTISKSTSSEGFNKSRKAIFKALAVGKSKVINLFCTVRD